MQMLTFVHKQANEVGKVMYALEHTAHHDLKIRSLQSGEGPCVIVVNGFLSQDELVPEHLWQPLLQQCWVLLR